MAPRAGISEILDECEPIGSRELSLGIVAGTPLLVSSKGEVDEWLVRYVNSCPEFTSLDLSSRRTSAREIGMWLSFLGSRDDPLTWLEAVEEDFTDYKIRRTDQFQFSDSVTGATWNKAVFALRGLYDWAITRRIPIVPGGTVLEVNPVPGGLGASRIPGVKANAAFVRTHRDRWIVPGTYKLWRDVGLRGNGLERTGISSWRSTIEDDSFRGRNALRNGAFTDFVYASGLRVQEAGSLLLPELPRGGAVEAKLPAGIAKYSKSRMCSGPPVTMRTVDSYVREPRRAAIGRAIREGRYERIANIMWVVDVRRARGGTLEVVLDGGEVRSLNLMRPAERQRLFWLRDGRPEPMSLWLSEDGTPFRHTSWSDIFVGANDPVFALIEETGGSEDVKPFETGLVIRFV